MEKYFSDIEAYLDESMAAAERQIFEEKLKTDAQLQAEFQEFKVLQTDLAYHFAARDVAAAAKLRSEIESKNRMRMRVFISLLAILLAGLLFFGKFFQKNQGQNEGQNLPQNPPVPPLETAPLPNLGTPEIEKPVEKQDEILSDPNPKTPKPKTQPIAGDLNLGKNRPADLLRDLPKEPIDSTFQKFFAAQMKGFSPAVPATGIWKPAVEKIQRNEAGKAFSMLKNLPAGFAKNDTTVYLLAVSELLLFHPTLAEERLYPLISQKKWQTEGQYLLVWVYLLQGKVDLAEATLKNFPDDFRDKKAIGAFLEK